MFGSSAMRGAWHTVESAAQRAFFAIAPAARVIVVRHVS